MSGKANTPRRAIRQGQGVIEYAGALVVAAVLISMAMFIVPAQVANMVNSIVATAGTYFTGQLPN